ncbi:unnamed protein product [Moneuplotes crassus]|uniref:Uncharacterized protein n=1 Tax=Euplotes crassus TaxID=5936 RepID=A0AAD1U1Y2_EUPCR|nr:unnamed protein product [Moneuplotes crassus]
MIITFFLFFLLGNKIVLAQAFAAGNIFYTLEEPIKWIPQFIGTCVEFLVSMNRIEKFLKCDELNPKIVEMDNEFCKKNEISIMIEGANFTWGGGKVKETDEKGKDNNDNEDAQEEVKKHKSSHKPFTINDEYQSLDTDDIEEGTTTSDSSQSEHQEKKLIDSIELQDINLQIQEGEFVCVIGEVGSGKSSLLSAILGDMLYLSTETIDANQDRTLDDELRKELLQKASVEQSIIKLGGSISYAQQVPWIQNKSIRENILFGLQMDEAKYNEVIEMCELGPDLEALPGGDLTEIGEKGINLSGGQKARVSLARAIYADRDILLMDDPVSALDANVKKKLKEVFLNKLKYKTRVLVTHAIDFIDCVDRIIVMEAGKIKYCGTYEELEHQGEIKHIIEALAHKTKENKPKEEEKQLENMEDNNILEEENQEKSFISEQGTRVTDEENDEKIDVGWRVYFTFFFSNKLWLFYIATFPLFAIYAYFIVNHTITFGYWIEESYNGLEYSRNFFIVVFYPIAYSLMISMISGVITISVLRSSKLLYEKMTNMVGNAPINLYFDKTPTGRILNRFSKDIDKVDTQVAQRLMWITDCYVSFLYNLFIAIFAMPWSATIVPVTLLICYCLTVFFLKPYRDLKRLTSTTLSPLLSQLSETLAGSSTIRSFNNYPNTNNLINNYVNANFWSGAMRRWFIIRLELACRLIIILGLALMVYFRNQVDPVLVGVFLVHMLGMNGEIIQGTLMTTELEADLVSYERCTKLLEIPQEKSNGSETVPSSWPRCGNIQFNNFSLKYRPSTPLVLKSLCFSIKNGEKVGVIGRTGAGKSTLCLALCRIIEAYQGSIIIDGQDISKLSLEDLRNNITIIPQDPTLFNGTLRFNLDPEGIHSDSELLDLVSQASLDKLVERDAKGLDQNIEEAGTNLSSGQKQLLCICRAILRKSKVVLMDEATANIDIKTEQTIQNLITTQFTDSTVLTIAHRLNTIINSDRVLILDQGEVVENERHKVNNR